jgi:hypothetical protein
MIISWRRRCKARSFAYFNSVPDVAARRLPASIARQHPHPIVTPLSRVSIGSPPGLGKMTPGARAGTRFNGMPTKIAEIAAGASSPRHGYRGLLNSAIHTAGRIARSPAGRPGQAHSFWAEQHQQKRGGLRGPPAPLGPNS